MTIHWRELVPADLGSIAALAQRSAAVDGGMAATTSESYLERRYTGLETAGVGAFEADSLIACGAVRAAGDAVAAVGQVDPEHRGLGQRAAVLCASPRSVGLDFAGSPGLVEPCFERSVEAEDGEPALPGDGS